MKKIIEASELPEGELVYLKKDWLGWRVVQPVYNPDGTTNWFNVLTGGKKNIFILIILLILCLIFYMVIKEFFIIINIIKENSCNLCTQQIKDALTGGIV